MKRYVVTAVLDVLVKDELVREWELNPDVASLVKNEVESITEELPLLPCVINRCVVTTFRQVGEPGVPADV